MKLKEWREKKALTQQAIADDLSEMAGKTILQRSISAWENGCLPRKFWLHIIEDYTKGKVRANDFA